MGLQEVGGGQKNGGRKDRCRRKRVEVKSGGIWEEGVREREARKYHGASSVCQASLGAREIARKNSVGAWVE